MSSWMNNGYGSTGYNPNQSVQLEDIVTNIIRDALSNAQRTGQYPQEVLAASYDRLMYNLNGICNNIQRTFMDRNNQIDGNQVYQYLTNNDIPSTVNSVMNEFRSRYNGYNNYNNVDYNRGYNNGNGYNNYNNGYNQVRANTVWNNTINTGTASSQYGIGRVLSENTMQAINNNYNQPNSVYQQTPQNNIVNNTNINYNPNTVTVERKEPVSVDLFKGFVDSKVRRQNQISIDKLTDDTSELVNNKEYLKNHINDPNIPLVNTINNTGTPLNPENINTIVDSEPEMPEYCTATEFQDVSERGNVVNTSNFSLEIPVVNAKEAIELVKEAVPTLTENEAWISTIEYKELVAKKLPGCGIEAKSAFNTIRNNINKLNSLNDVSNYIVPIIKRQNTIVREYLDTLIFDRINKLFKMTIFHPEKPSFYPVVNDWAAVYDLVDKNNRDIKYIDYMFDNFGDTYVKTVFNCVKSALNDIFNADEENTVLDVSVESDSNLGDIAKLSNITAVVGKFRMSDYGYIPDNYKKQLFSKFNHDYIVHKYNQNTFVTNIEIDKYVGSESKFTIIDGITNISQYVIHALLTSLREHNVQASIPLIQLDKSGNYIVGTYTISLGFDNTILITKV